MNNEKITITEEEIKKADKADELKQIRFDILNLKKALALALGGYAKDFEIEKTDTMINFLMSGNFVFSVAKKSFVNVTTPKAEKEKQAVSDSKTENKKI